MMEKLQKLIKGEVETTEAMLKKYSRDTSLFEVRPKAVVFPKDVEDLKNLVLFAKENKIALIPRSAGSDMSGGAIGEGIIVDFTKYFKKVEVGKAEATSEPGVFYRDFEHETLKKNLLMPSFPASRELAAIGGMVANNAGGEKTLSYGKTIDYVLELKVMLSDANEYTIKPLTAQELKAKTEQDDFEGRLYKKVFDLIEANYEIIQKARPAVSKNSSGYYLWDVWDKKTFDLTKLIVGSQGTLGFITQVKFKLIKPKSNSRLLVVFLKEKNLASLGQIVNKVLEYRPETFESYDDHTLQLAIKFFPQFVKKLKSNVFSLGLKFLPEVGMVLRGGLPKLVLTAEFTAESDKQALAQAEEAQRALEKFGLNTRITKSDAEAAKYKTIRRESFNLLREKIKDKQTAPFIDDIIVRPEVLPEFLPKLEAVLEDYPGLIYTVAGHIGNGNFHIIPLMDLSDPDSPKIIAELSEKVYKLVFEYNGSMSAEHNDGLIRGPYLAKMFGEEVYKIFQEVKHIFDPENIFNPGKKVDTDQKFAVEHIKHS